VTQIIGGIRFATRTATVGQTVTLTDSRDNDVDIEIRFKP
jgi:hypothetical protein